MWQGRRIRLGHRCSHEEDADRADAVERGPCAHETDAAGTHGEVGGPVLRGIGREDGPPRHGQRLRQPAGERQDGRAASRGQSEITGTDEQDLRFRGLLVFLDPPKATARRALGRLAGLGVTVKILTGDNPAVAAKVCTDLGLPEGWVATGADIDAAGEQLGALLEQATVFARVSPEHKAQIVRAQRRTGEDVAFLGDGVNDAVALHAADVGISVDSATDVAKDAADVLLLEKDLDVLADGVMEGRRIFANTMKYVLMGTSSNFGNMFSAAGASLFLTFLPMLPPQILLNNLLYDTSQLAIPTDNVDPEQVARPSRWDVGFIRRFMLFFGPISSLFDFATFGIMLWVFHAGPALFRAGWFVESFATQTLVSSASRTRRIPFFPSTPTVPLPPASLGQAPARRHRGRASPATACTGALPASPPRPGCARQSRHPAVAARQRPAVSAHHPDTPMLRAGWNRAGRRRRLNGTYRTLEARCSLSVPPARASPGLPCWPVWHWPASSCPPAGRRTLAGPGMAAWSWNGIRPTARRCMSALATGSS